MKIIAKISIRNLYISYKQRWSFIWYSGVLEGLNTDCLRKNGFIIPSMVIHRLTQKETPICKLTERKKRYFFLEKEIVFKTIDKHYRTRRIKGMWPF